MSSIGNAIARRAVKSTAKHTAHGTASKLKRSPVRATTLLGVGCVVGIAVGAVLGRPDRSST